MTSTSNTRWSLVQDAKGDTPQGRAALSELCAIYYAPVRSFVKQWCRDAAEVDDLTQSFFARLLEGEALNGADASRGKFRTYLIGAVKHFITDQHRQRGTMKRGAGCEHEDDDALLSIADGNSPSPDVEFDRAWAYAVIDRTLTRLETEMHEAGKTQVFDALKPWLAGLALHGETTAVAEKLGISETAVRVILSRLRKRMRELMHDELAQTLADGGDVEAELRHLAEALRR